MFIAKVYLEKLLNSDSYHAEFAHEYLEEIRKPKICFFETNFVMICELIPEIVEELMLSSKRFAYV